MSNRETDDKGHIMERIDTSNEGSGENMSEPSVSESNSSSLRRGTSTVRISGSSSPISPQLEQLSNTNLLTVRILFLDGKYELENKKQIVLEGLESIMHHYKGFIVDDEHIETYEYLPDSERQSILRENKDIYIYENRNTEFYRSYLDDSGDLDWKYNKAFLVQFKRCNILPIVAEESRKYLENHKDVVKRWSISTNDHALTQPGNLYVRGIPKELTVDQLLPIFSKFGPVSSLKIICDETTGESLGYGFFSYPLGSQASHCIHELNGTKYENSTLFVNYHIERKERERIYRDNIKENSGDDTFKSVFIGNIPLYDSSKNSVTPDTIIELLTEKVGDELSDFKIVSHYFPKRGENEQVDSREKTVSPDVMEANSENKNEEDIENEESRFRNYGFVKFTTHKQALRTIELLNNHIWHGAKLIVNKAEKNKYQGHHQRPFNENTALQEAPSYSGQYPLLPYNASPNVNAFGYYSGSGNMFFPFIGPQALHQNPYKNKRQDMDSIYGIGQPIGSGPVINPFQVYGTISTTNDSTTFDGTNANSSIYPVNPYAMIPHTTQLVLPVPTKDQQESNLYVKHLPLNWKDNDLSKFYSRYGEIISAKVITVGGSKNKDNKDNGVLGEDSSSSSEEAAINHPSLGTSRGYGFVCFKNPLDASRAIMSTDGYQLSAGHILNVSFAQKRAKSIAHQGGQMNRQASNSPNNAQPKRNGRSLSYTEQAMQNVNPTFMNVRRNQSNNNSGRNFSKYSHEVGNWAPLPALSNGGPGITGMTFLQPTPSSMMGSYMIQPNQVLYKDSD